MKRVIMVVSVLVITGGTSLGAQELKELDKKEISTINIDFNGEITSSYIDKLESADEFKDTMSRSSASQKKEGFDKLKNQKVKKEVVIKDIDLKEPKKEVLLKKKKKTVKLKVKVKKHDIESTMDQALDHEISSLDVARNKRKKKD